MNLLEKPVQIMVANTQIFHEWGSKRFNGGYLFMKFLGSTPNRSLNLLAKTLAFK